MANIYVEKKISTSDGYKEPLLAASVTGYARGLAVAFTGGNEFGCTLATALGQVCTGIIEEDQVVGAGAMSPTNPIGVIELGPAVAQIGASIIGGQLLTTNAAGQLVPAASGQSIVAIALESQTYVSPGSYAGVFVCAILGYLYPGSPVAAGVTYETGSGAIPLVSGAYALDGAAALAMTLATPTTPAQDGIVIKLTALTAHAHKVSTAANKINGNMDTITYAAVGDSVTLESMGGIWVATSLTGPTPAVLSEV
jgi:hypothetical protein